MKYTIRFHAGINIFLAHRCVDYVSVLSDLYGVTESCGTDSKENTEKVEQSKLIVHTIMGESSGAILMTS